MPHLGSRAALLLPVLVLLAVVMTARSSPVEGGVQIKCVITVNTTDDNTNLDSDVTLREAIGFATDLYSPAGGELDQVSGCPNDDDNPGAGRSDIITFDPTVFPPETGGTIELGSNLPELDSSGDQIDGIGAKVTVDGVTNTFNCFEITSSFNTIVGLQIVRCDVGVLIGFQILAGEPDIGPAGGGIFGNLVAVNTISLNETGVLISGGGVFQNVVSGNWIGTDATGSQPAPNDFGVLVFADNNTVGRGQPTLFAENVGVEGNLFDLGNVISGNLVAGILIDSADGTKVMGNIIGLDSNGVDPLPNANGVIVQSSGGVEIGSDDPEDRNLISANDFNGIQIEDAPILLDASERGEGGPSSGSQIYGNFIGTDITGTLGLGNGEYGVIVDNAPFNEIGGSGPGEGNVISGNGFVGVLLRNQGATFNRVEGNLIGTDVTGFQAIPNGDGVEIENAPANDIGGGFPGAGNVISGNNVSGVYINGSDSEENYVSGNFIGTAIDGETPLGNDAQGVEIVNTGPNLIGGSDPEDGNVIAFNGENGVMILALPSISQHKRILTNSIHSNGELGIDLSNDGVTLNDGGDPDGGANEQQNYPVLQSAHSEDGVLTVTGTLNSSANDGFRIQFFVNTECDPSDFGEGETYVGETIVNTDGSGDATIDEDLPPVTPGTFLTATATDPDSNTSEFSRCVEVTGPLTLIWGDADCNGDADVYDALLVLEDLAGVDVLQASQCPALGDTVLIDGVPRVWGDWDCSGSYDPLDAIAGLMYLSDLDVSAPVSCPDIGEEVEVEEIEL